jgi:hypothetical protein
MRPELFAALALAGLGAGHGAMAEETPTPPGGVYQAPSPPQTRRAFFGEMHLHTTMSFDAWSFSTKVTPDQAYRFGRGETVMVPVEQVNPQLQIAATEAVPAKRAWPLDFMAVTDHSEAMGVLNMLDDPANPLRKTKAGQALLKDPKSAFAMVVNANRPGAPPPAFINMAAAAKSAWDVEIKAANDNYLPGKFTTFIAYEWSALAQGKYNLHRNVFFNANHAPLPYSSQQSTRPEDLWTYLEKVRAQGVDVIAIPHNGNVSGGLMYDWNDSDGRPIDQQYAQRRALNEPLTEIAQNKGQSDTLPELSPSDEFANFEIFDSLLTHPSIKSRQAGGFIRQAFGRGLVIEAKVGANPYKYGLVGASDFHNGLSTSDEKAFAGDAFGIDPNTMTPSRAEAKVQVGIDKRPSPLDVDAAANHTPPALENALQFGSAGVTGVWAEENTRNSIFAALKRKETFATSGTRIRVRMFGGWDFRAGALERPDWVAAAYAAGVAMGSDLPARPGSARAPRLLVEALKDPDGANLDRIQIIKIWLDHGTYREKIFNAALSGGRRPGPGGKVPPVGNTVDLMTGAYKNSIGAAILKANWRDPEFDPKRPAVYYARVLEIPTPRWSTLLSIKVGLPISKSVPATLQERAWTSPIWFTPAKG